MKEKSCDLTKCRTKELLDYRPDDGCFIWRVSSRNAKKGSIAGYLTSNGYIRIQVDGIQYLAHRLAWLWVYGSWPKDQIDHINMVRSDNRICNLRECNHSENMQNQKYAQRNSASGFLGVTNRGKYGFEARIIKNKKFIYLGKFLTAEDASAAYMAAKSIHHDFVNIGKRP